MKLTQLNLLLVRGKWGLKYICHEPVTSPFKVKSKDFYKFSSCDTFWTCCYKMGFSIWESGKGITEYWEGYYLIDSLFAYWSHFGAGIYLINLKSASAYLETVDFRKVCVHTFMSNNYRMFSIWRQWSKCNNIGLGWLHLCATTHAKIIVLYWRCFLPADYIILNCENGKWKL